MTKRGEAMARVEEGLPATPLPMANPNDYRAEPVYDPTQPQATGQRTRRSTGNGLIDLLGSILRGN